ncbi:DUF2264 domain-containing protein [Galbibacter orientalis]|uniref:DUF2264 domain-containing protein n=1 Tax=Galbibacter orientalis TaxID=453852 RepID=UPI003080373E
MKRRKFINTSILASLSPYLIHGNIKKQNINTRLESKKNDRVYWYKLLKKITHPVFYNLANDSLVQNMPVEKSPLYDDRKNVTYLEAVGRASSGLAPWLSIPDDDSREGNERKIMKELFLEGMSNGVNKNRKDYLNFRTEKQPIVDAAYLVLGLIRAKKSLWDPLSNKTKENLITELKALRSRKPHHNNWLIFRAITESFLFLVEEEYDQESIEYAVKKFNDWYVGDGWYGDGEKFTFDYYNSYVMHPMMIETLNIVCKKNLLPMESLELAKKRMSRYVSSLERMISPEGTFPVIGRSITYRTGAFHALAMSALNQNLPSHISPSQVRNALTEVKRNLLNNEIFDKSGWLKLGFSGHQPDMADYYTSTGSLYMTTLSFLPLGLPETNEFWSDKPKDWTSKKAWNDQSVINDYHVQF